MSTITAKDVMSLRQRTGMGMMECKAALAEADGDVAKAVEILRAAAKGKMDERSDRAAAEGALAVASQGNAVALIELNSETDFTAKNDQFVAAADKVAQLALQQPDGDVKLTAAITDAVDAVRLTTKENCSFKRGVKVTGVVGTYLHHNRKVGAIVVVSGAVDTDTLTGLAQHVVTSDGLVRPIPLAIDEAGLPADAVAKAKAAFIQEAKDSGKPADIAEKMSTGKMRKWVADNTLLGQPFVRDMTGKTSVASVLPKGVKILAYHRYSVGCA